MAVRKLPTLMVATSALALGCGWGGPPRFKRAGDPCAAREKGGLFTYVFDWKGKKTEALLFVPRAAGPHPVVVVLHGGGMSPQEILDSTHWDDVGEQEGFVVLAPESSTVAGSRIWNSGKYDEPGRDDVAYLSAITAAVTEDTCGREVLATGFSSGAQMANRWACQADVPDAVLAVAGSLLVDAGTCRGARPVLSYVGTSDKNFTPGATLSVVDSVALWAGINACGPRPPTTSTVADATCSRYRGCSASTELCVVDGFGHGWPSPWSKAGKTSTDATRDGWAWFEEEVLR